MFGHLKREWQTQNKAKSANLTLNTTRKNVLHALLHDISKGPQALLHQKFAKSFCISTITVAFLISFAAFIQTLDIPFIDINGFTINLLGTPLSLSFRLDFLAITLCMMVSLLALVIANFSHRYLSGEEKSSYFYWNLLAIVLTVFCFLLSNNIFSFFLAWLIISRLLKNLLSYFRSRPAAMLAVKKKSYIDLIGYTALLLAFILLFKTSNHVDFSGIANAVQAGSFNTLELELISILLVLAAMSMSAQFPLHSWLPESLETPTPVSALMHAGVINAGGFVIIRFSWLLESTRFSHDILTIVGAMTAVFGALCMVTQNSIKKKLAYSTMSQMGMMLFACGLQLYGVALFHILVHSFYKAHAFLSTGSLIEEKNMVSLKLKSPPNALITVMILASYIIIFFSPDVFGSKTQSIITYASVLSLGLLQNYASMPKSLQLGFRPYGLIFVILAIASIGYVSLDSIISKQLARSYLGSLSIQTNPISSLSKFIAYSIFAIGFYLSTTITRNHSKIAKRLYFVFWNGAYFNHYFTRLLHNKASKG
jgi:NAD(P)H-quinone oxidoreductase subunit 5